MGSRKDFLHKFRVLVGVGVAIMVGGGLLLGCARTVTDVISYGSQLCVTVTFNDNLDIAANNYFMVISSQEAFQIPYVPYENYEFLEPGLPATDITIDYYQYYRTWDAYLILGSSGIIWLVQGPFNSSAEAYSSYTRVQVGTYVGSSNQWTFNFDLDDLYAADALPTNIYFDVVSVSTTTSQLQDHLTGGPYISTYTNSTASGAQAENTDLAGSANIRSYNLMIY